MKIRVITASNCVTIYGFDWDRIPDYSQSACKSSIVQAEQYIGEVDTVIIAGMWQYHAKSERFMAALEGYIRGAANRGKNIIVIAQVPMLSGNVQRANRFESLGIKFGGSSIHPEWQAANEAVMNLVAGIPNVRFIDFSNEALFRSLPFYNGIPIYHDSNHLNESGSKELGKAAVQTMTGFINADWPSVSVRRLHAD